MIKPLDFVRPKGVRGKGDPVVIIDQNNGMVSFASYLGEPYPNQYVGLVTEVDKSGKCSIEWLGEGNKHLHNAWWKPEELQKEDSLPNLLAREMAHPFGQNREKADEFYERR